MHIALDGTRFDYLDEGSGTAVVLLHGFPLAKETWDVQAAALARSARVVRFDFRGLGRSAVTPGPYLMESLASDVAALLDALAIERAVIVGHSLGGYVAFAFYRLFAERCLALGIVCSRPNADDPSAASARYELAAKVESGGMEAVAEWLIARYFAPDFYARQAELVARAREIVLRTDPRGAAAMLRGMAERVSSTDLFAEIDVPMHVIAGADDGAVPLAEVRAMAGAIRGAELAILPCGHIPQFEVPGALTASLERLLESA